MTTPEIAPPTAPPVWVHRPETFQRMTAGLAQCPLLAVDTESNSLYAYYEQVCLVQISTGQTDYLVDPLALDDLSALGPLFASPAIEKIFHAAEYDVICLKRDFNFSFENIFDTMVAARILGREAVGLGSVLEVEFGISLDKRYQRANWGERPLLPSLLAYARLDSCYLIPLRHRLKAALEESGRWPLAQEDFRRLCRTPVPETGHNNSWSRLPGAQDLTPRQAAILNELCHYRDHQAAAANLPAFKILSNQTLMAVALAAPTNAEEMRQVDGISPRLLQRHGNGLLHAVLHGIAARPLHRPHTPRPDERYLQRLDRLRDWRKQTGKKLGVESDVILPREVMETMAQSAPHSMGELELLMKDLPWRLEHFGPELMAILAK